MRPILLLLLIPGFLSDTVEEQIARCTIDAVKSPSKTSDCTDVLGTEAKNEGYHCCYIEYKYKNNHPEKLQKEGAYCGLFTKTMYDNLKDEIKKTKKEAKNNGYEVSKLKVKCHSSYLKIGVIGLIFALIL